MDRRVWLLNLALIAVLIALGRMAHHSWTESVAPLSARGGTPADQGAPPVPPPLPPDRLVAESMHRAVARGNLFSPERSEHEPPPPKTVAPTPEEKTAPAEPAVIEGREIRLHGVVLAGNYRKALLDNLERDAGDPPTVWVAPGDVVGGARILSIQPERVRLEFQGSLMQVPLYDPEAARSASPPNNANPKSGKPRVFSAGSPAPGGENSNQAGDSREGASQNRRDMTNPFIRKDIPLPSR
jgi:hypothetical protein